MRTPPIYHLANRIHALATEWANQGTDYDEDTEQQIADGKEILALFEECGFPSERPKFDINAALNTPTKETP